MRLTLSKFEIAYRYNIMDQTVKAGATHVQGYTAFDVETPNWQQHSICSIGLVHVESGQDPISIYYLVNPEEAFDEANISIHGIRPADVKDAPIFLEVWNQISDWFTNGIVVAHNATFDLSVLQKTLERHELPVPDFYYTCTFEKAKKHIPYEQFGSYKLNLLCDGFHIPLAHHHNALDDAMACATLYENLLSKYGCLDEDIRVYRYTGIKEDRARDKASDQALNTLHGLLLGIGFDRMFLPAERDALSAWVQEHRVPQPNDIRTCRNAIIAALEDGVLTKQEHENLVRLSFAAASCGTQFCITTQATQLLMGILEGISCDGMIQDEEASRLMEWMNEYDYLKGFYPYDKMFSMLIPMLEDRHIDAEEQALLLSQIQLILHPVAVSFGIQYEGSTFCLTGDFSHGTKEEVGDRIIALGGSIAGGVSKKVDYVVVGGQGSEKWSFGNYGGKVKRALALIEQGAKIEIVGEEALFDD